MIDFAFGNGHFETFFVMRILFHITRLPSVEEQEEESSSETSDGDALPLPDSDEAGGSPRKNVARKNAEVWAPHLFKELGCSMVFCSCHFGGK